MSAPPAGRAGAETLLRRLHACAAEHYAGPPQPAVVKVVVRTGAEPTAESGFELGDTLAIAPADAVADATVTLTAGALAAILAAPALFDPRNAALQTRLSIDGDVLAAHYLLQFLKRPTPAAAARLERARWAAPDDLDAVPESTVADPHAVLAALAASRPLCLRDVLDWPALQLDFDELAARYGDVLLSRDAVSGRVQPLRDFVAALTGAARAAGTAAPYTDGCLLPPALSGLFPFPLFADGDFGPAQLWCGARRTDELVTWLHCDVMSSFLAQVLGRKKVRLYTPAQRDRLYPFGAFNTHQPCRVDAARPDLSCFPLFAQARPLDVVIGPGDLLIVPTGWYHCVWALDDVLSVSRFLDDDVADRLRERQ